VSDKPAWVRELPTLSPGKIEHIDRVRLGRYRTLLGVDDAVERIVSALRDTGRLDKTLIVFMSDNGAMWGEHRLAGKAVPYQEATRVPFVIRYDALVAAPGHNNQLVLNIDLAPTFADVSGAAAPGAEGTSLVPLLGASRGGWRTDFLGEHLMIGEKDNVPTYCAIRTNSYAYVQYVTGEEELYEVIDDSLEMQNRAGDPSFAQILDALRLRLEEECSPPPPGFLPLEG
jgi:N-acetylglucosamine-6-sulfatase